MQQLLALWRALQPRQRLIAAGAAAVMFAAVLFLAGASGRPSMALLYAGLDQARAGEVLTALERHGITYDIRADSIYVEAPRRDEMRMLLAAEGLPANGGAGYELLDGLSGFGTTTQMFDAAYLRAKEGEIARTIAALPDVRFARVHIADAEPSGFRRAAEPTASIMVATSQGGVSADRARALRFLVASAVAGLHPEDVSVLDGQGNLVPATEAPDTAGGTRAEELRRAVERLLEARVGTGNVVVEVSVDTVTEQETISERTIDPDSRTAISTDSEERSDSGTDGTTGAVTVASNLPTGDAGDSGRTTSSQSSETRERVNFEISETRRELLRVPGAIRRQTVAVLLNAPPDTPEGRSEDEIAALRELVAAAIGFDEERGDVVSIRSLPFEPAPDGSEIATAPWFAMTPVDMTRLVQSAAAALVALALGLFVVRPILSGARLSETPAPAIPARPHAKLDPEALTGEIADDDRTIEPGPAFGFARASGDVSVDPVTRLRTLMVEKREETAEILRSWMAEDEKGEAQ